MNMKNVLLCPFERSISKHVEKIIVKYGFKIFAEKMIAFPEMKTYRRHKVVVEVYFISARHTFLRVFSI